MLLKLIHQYITEKPKLLQSQLSQLENNVATAVESLSSGKVDQPTGVRFTPQSSPAATMTTRQIALCETSTGNVAFALTAPSDGLPGFMWVLKKSAANSVTLRPSGLSSGVARTINGASSKVYAAATIGLFALYYDGSNWWAA